MARTVKFEIFRGTFTTWDGLFERAASFASSLDQDRLISISHTNDNGQGVVAVWYWEGATKAATNQLGLKEND